jgi:hypothetical protein
MKLQRIMLVATTASMMQFILVTAAGSANLEPSSQSVCSSAPALASVAKDFLATSSGRSSASVRSDTVHISGSGSVMTTASGERHAMGIRTPSKPNVLCQAIREGRNVNLAPHGDVDGASLVALKSVVDYRILHPWPGAGAPIDSPATTVYATTRGKYVFVGLIADKTLFKGCTGEENYRVDPVTQTVLPYDNCLEGHKRIFPGLAQLPN